MEHRPPEFPAWMDTVPAGLSTITYIPNLSIAVDNILQDSTSVQIKQEHSDYDGNATMPGKIKTDTITDDDRTDETQTPEPMIEPLSGTNIMNTDDNPVVDVPSIEDIWNDSLITEQNPVTPGENSANPIWLKMSSVQKLLESFHVLTPPSLMQLCCDYIS